MKNFKFAIIIALSVALVNPIFASNVYVPQKNTVSNQISEEEMMKAVSDKIKSVKTVFECKDVVTDVNQLETITFGKMSLSDDPSERNDIEWFVMDKNDTSAFLVAKQVLGKSEYNDLNKPVAFYGTKISKWIDDFELKSFSNDEQKLITGSRIVTKADIDKCFTSADGNKNLAIATYAIGSPQPIDYWLANTEKSETAYFFSTYGTYYSGQLGEKIGVRPVIIVKLSPLQ